MVLGVGVASRRQGPVVLALTVLAMFILVSCGGPRSADPGDPHRELKELLGRSAGIEGMSYLVVTHYPIWSHEARVWVQGDLIKTETVLDGQTLVVVIDNALGELYAYDGAENVVTRMSLGQGHVSTPESPIEYVREMKPDEWVLGGVTFVDGLRCCRLTRDDPRGETVLHIWEEYGLPLRVESTVDGRTTVTEFREMEVGLLPEGTFDLPAGVQVLDFWEDEPAD